MSFTPTSANWYPATSTVFGPADWRSCALPIVHKRILELTGRIRGQDEAESTRRFGSAESVRQSHALWQTDSLERGVVDGRISISHGSESRSNENGGMGRTLVALALWEIDNNHTHYGTELIDVKNTGDMRDRTE